MATQKTSVVDANASSIPVQSGKSSITSFRYFDKLCFATLKNGVSGIVGDTTSCGLASMLALKGSGIQVSYKVNGTWTDKEGKTHPRYQLEWSLE